MRDETKCSGEPVFGVPVWQASFCVGVFFVLMLLLNGSAMLKSSQQLEFGPVRDFLVAVIRPIAQISHVSRLDRIRSESEDVFGVWLNQSVQKKKETR